MSYADRIQGELASLKSTAGRLNAFMVTAEYAKLDQLDKILIKKQRDVMDEYVVLLMIRLDRARKDIDDGTD